MKLMKDLQIKSPRTQGEPEIQSLMSYRKGRRQKETQSGSSGEHGGREAGYRVPNPERTSRASALPANF